MHAYAGRERTHLLLISGVCLCSMAGVRHGVLWARQIINRMYAAANSNKAFVQQPCLAGI